MIEEIRNKMLAHEKELGKYATLDKSSIRLREEIKEEEKTYVQSTIGM